MSQPPANKVFEESESVDDVEKSSYFVELQVWCDGVNSDGVSTDILADSNDLVSSVVEKVMSRRTVPSSLLVKNRSGKVLSMSDTLAAAHVKPVDILYIGGEPEVEILDSKLQPQAPVLMPSHLDRKCSTPCRWVMAAYISLTLALALLATAVTLWLLNCSAPHQYLILIDAGSVHTSVYTYRYSFPTELGSVEVRETRHCELDSPSGTVGISSFQEQPSRAAFFVTNNSCIQDSLSSIPPVSRSVSRMHLGSTAGMRILMLAQPLLAHQILANLTLALQSAATGYGLQAGAGVLTGLQEAQDGWVTANYLTKSLDGADHTLGALDWGGASSQISTSVAKDPTLPPLHLNGSDYLLGARSDLCYGQSEALGRHRSLLLHTHFTSNNRSLHTTQTIKIHDPCLPARGHVTLLLSSLGNSPCTQLKDSAFINLLRDPARKSQEVTFVNPTLEKNSSATCDSLVEEAFHPEACRAKYVQPQNESICLDPASIPSPLPDQPYLAMSTYWYLTNTLDLGPTISLAKFSEAKAGLCSSDFVTLVRELGRQTAEIACYQATFMRSLLLTGYHFTNWEKIHFVKNLGGAEVGWTLGHAIAKANSIKPEERPIKKEFISTPHFVVMLLLSGMSALVALLLAYQGRKAGVESSDSSYETLI